MCRPAGAQPRKTTTTYRDADHRRHRDDERDRDRQHDLDPLEHLELGRAPLGDRGEELALERHHLDHAHRLQHLRQQLHPVVARLHERARERVDLLEEERVERQREGHEEERADDARADHTREQHERDRRLRDRRPREVDVRDRRSRRRRSRSCCSRV